MPDKLTIQLVHAIIVSTESIIVLLVSVIVMLSRIHWQKQCTNDSCVWRILQRYKQTTLSLCWCYGGSVCTKLGQHKTSSGSWVPVIWVDNTQIIYTRKPTRHLYQTAKRWRKVEDIEDLTGPETQLCPIVSKWETKRVVVKLRHLHTEKDRGWLLWKYVKGPDVFTEDELQISILHQAHSLTKSSID